MATRFRLRGYRRTHRGVSDNVLIQYAYATLRTDERGEKLWRVQQIAEWSGSDSME